VTRTAGIPAYSRLAVNGAGHPADAGLMLAYWG